jgi:DNA-binding MarR family transcriptional regulator
LVLLASRGPQSMGEIAEQLGVNPSNASRQCDRLQRLGLLVRARSAADARVVRAEVSSAGRRLLGAVTQRRREELRRVVERMDGADVAVVAAALRSFNAAADEMGDNGWASLS